MSMLMLMGILAANRTFATISVTYPVGSICTCSNGSRSITAKDTSGVWNFLVPEGGTWTVECHTTGKSKSTTVYIGVQYQAVSVTLAYTIVLFDGASGGDNASVTGGWFTENTDGKASTIVGSTAITGARTAPYPNQVASAFAATKNAIDLTGVSILRATFTQATGATVYIGNGSTAANVDGMIDGNAASVSGSVGTVQIDVSQLSGSYQIGIGRGWQSPYDQNFTVTKVWAE